MWFCGPHFRQSYKACDTMGLLILRFEQIAKELPVAKVNAQGNRGISLYSIGPSGLMRIETSDTEENISTMGALPKQRTSRGRQGRRRSHLRAEIPTLVPCPNCKEMKVLHHVCPACGVYNGRQVITLKGTTETE